MHGHAMHVLMLRGWPHAEFCVYCICGWHCDVHYTSLHEAAMRWHEHSAINFDEGS